MLYASSTDKTVYAYSVSGTKLAQQFKIPLDAPAISLDMMNGKLLAGLKNGAI